MLNIPDAIKTLFKTDGTRKNFRVHFPNGEYSDITNDNVVRESVRFTESLCSQNTFRFGLAEASIIEFETVGVGNMYGMAIECGIEVDTTSLSAAQISAIQSDPGDGTLVLAAASDIGYGYYRVPLGTFKVTACPRNHGAMAHRKVTGMSDYTGGVVQNSPYEIAKLDLGLANGASTYTPNIPRLIMAALACRNPSLISGLPVSSSSGVTAGTVGDIGQKTIGGVLIYGYRRSLTAGQLADNLMVLELADYDPASVTAWIRTKFEAKNLGEYADEAADYIRQKMGPFVNLHGPNVLSFPAVDDKLVWYPYGSGQQGLAPRMWVWAQIYLRFPDSTVESSSFDIIDVAASTQKVLSDTFPNIRGAFGPTSWLTNDWPTFVDSYDFNDLFAGWLEVNGQFGQKNRDGQFDMVVLDGSQPVPVTATDYESVWWDEYNVAPVGTARVSFKEDGEEQTQEIAVGDGQSIYDMTDNNMLQAVDGTTVSDVETMLNTYFVPQLPTVAFTPVEMTMQGWPWIEAGDAMQITAEDGTVIDTFALRVELSGIQRLSMDVESKAGKIIGEV